MAMRAHLSAPSTDAAAAATLGAEVEIKTEDGAQEPSQHPARVSGAAKASMGLVADVNWHDPPRADALALAGLIGEGAQLWSRPEMRVLAVELTEAEAEAAGRASALATLVVVGVLPAGAADCQYSVVSAARSAAMAAIREYQELEDDEYDAFDDDDAQEDSAAAATAAAAAITGAAASDTVGSEAVSSNPGAAAFGPGVTLALAGVEAVTATRVALPGETGKEAPTDPAAAAPPASTSSSSGASGSGGRASRRGGASRPAQAIGTPAERIAKRARLSAAHGDTTTSSSSSNDSGLGSGWNRLVREACGSIAAGKDWNAKADRAARRAEAQQRRIEAKAKAKMELKAELEAQTEHVWKPASVAAALSWDRPWHQRAAAVASMAQAAASAKGLAKPACYAAGSTAASALARRLQARGLHRAALEAQAVASAVTIFGGLDKPLPQAMGLALPSLPQPQARPKQPVPAPLPPSLLLLQASNQASVATAAFPRPAAQSAAAEQPKQTHAASSSSSSSAAAAASAHQRVPVQTAAMARAAPRQSTPALVATLSPAEKARAMEQLLALPPEARARLSPLQQQQVLVLQHVQQINQLKALLHAGQLHRHPAAIKFLGSQEAVDAVGRGEAEAVAQAGHKLTQLLNQAFTVMQNLQQQPQHGR
jgi:hypothetical protein